jgi:hypothetical protein
MQGKSVSRSKVFPTCNSREGCSALFTPWLFCLIPDRTDALLSSLRLLVLLDMSHKTLYYLTNLNPDLRV